VPLFDANFTDGEGVHGRLGPLGAPPRSRWQKPSHLGSPRGSERKRGPSRKRGGAATRRWS
jgi:hypothetical protein